jgi:hypothetical protein
MRVLSKTVCHDRVFKDLLPLRELKSKWRFAKAHVAGPAGSDQSQATMPSTHLRRQHLKLFASIDIAVTGTVAVERTQPLQQPPPTPQEPAPPLTYTAIQ